jgi:hypothetical protein
MPPANSLGNLMALSLLVDIALPGLETALSTFGLRNPFAVPGCTFGSSSSSMFDWESIGDDLELFASRQAPVSYMALTL